MLHLKEVIWIPEGVEKSHGLSSSRDGRRAIRMKREDPAFIMEWRDAGSSGAAEKRRRNHQRDANLPKDRYRSRRGISL
jgi:hypothetical protein